MPAPPLAGDAAADVAIVGGGFTGVSTALHIARRFPDRRVVLLEAKSLANGASGRNGGLVLNGLGGAHTDDVEVVRRIYDFTRSGIDLIEGLTLEEGLGSCFHREGALEVFTDARRADGAAAEVERMRAAGLPLRFLDASALGREVSLTGAAGAVLDPTAGTLDGVAFVRGLRPALERLGVGVYENTPVVSVREGSTVALTTPGGEVRAATMVLATNAYTPALGYFKDEIFPLHSHVIATEPLSPVVRARVGWPSGAGFSDDQDRLSYGGVGPRGEIVFGGGSNAAYEYLFGGRTRYPARADRAFEAIRRRLVSYLPATAELRVAHRWTGPVALTMSRVCTMGVRGEHRNVLYALGFSGHGITMACLAGRVLCDVYSGVLEPYRALPFFEQKLFRIPPEPLRWIGYHAYTAITGRSPRRGG